MNLTHFSLFTGIGGIDLAAEWAGFKTVGQVEKDEFCRKVLKKNFGDIPRWELIQNVTAENFRRRTNLQAIDLISGGFPCQPFSVAGQQKGKADDRYLWPEMFRVIEELRPTWVLGENVTGIDGLALDQVLLELEGIGYETAPPIEIPACAVNAPHRRSRIFIIAYSSSKRWSGILRSFSKTCSKAYRHWQTRSLDAHSHIIPRLEQSLGESSICRINDGIPNRVDRLRALGNAVVPQQIYPILKYIADIEKHKGELLIMKSESRVSKHYKKGTEDWEAQYNMLLEDNVTCGDCVHSQRCKMLFGGDDNNTSCQFYPNRFRAN